MTLKHYIIIFLWLLTNMNLTAQTFYNFVPNPSFEDNKNIPCHLVYKPSTFNQALSEWFVPSQGTPDIWSMAIDPSCDNFALGNQTYTTFTKKEAPIFGGIIPHSGNTMIGLATFRPKNDYREYAAIKLKEPLKNGEKYHVSFWVARAATTIFAANNLGILFSKDFINVQHDEVISTPPPQIYSQPIIKSTKWQQISGNFTATDSLQYLVIGNFFDNQQTQTNKIVKNIDANWAYTAYSAYYFIDDIEVTVYDNLAENQYAGVSNSINNDSNNSNDTLANWEFEDDSLIIDASMFDTLVSDNSEIAIKNTSFAENMAGNITENSMNTENIKPVFKLNKLTEITSSLFEYGTDNLTELGQETLQQLATFLQSPQNSSNTSVQVYVHYYLENEQLAMKLCNKRAKVIAKSLEKLGIAAKNINTKSFGTAILQYSNKKIIERIDMLVVEE